MQTPNQTPNFSSNMETYSGTKILKAVELSKKEYCNYRKWEVPEDEDPEELVYLVEYPVEEDTTPNHPLHKGYISMSPKKVFEKYYKKGEKKLKTTKTLTNTDAKGAKKQVKDIEFYGNGDTFQLICKASSQEEGWMKSTKAMEIYGCGCVVQVTTQQRNIDGTYAIAEALTFVPGALISIKEDNTKFLDKPF